MKTRPTVMFYSQHSLGMGHLVRSLALAQGLANEFRVVLLNGGRLPKQTVIPHEFEMINLPPIGLNENNELVSQDRRRTTIRARELRRQLLNNTFDELQPDVLFIELFPFGRKKFAEELMPLLQAARSSTNSRPLVVCSVRDILVGRNDQAKHDDRATTIANEYFDLILVHSDPAFARLDESFKPRVKLTTLVEYTGFAMASTYPEATKEQSAIRRIVVSAGGGMVGEHLLRTAVKAHEVLVREAPVETEIITGLFLPESASRSLRQLARGKEGLKLTRFVSDLSARMRNADVSISQGGYNTTLDILRAKVPALVVPFGTGKEDEQMRRARRLEALGAIRVLDEKDMEPVRLANEIRDLFNFDAKRPKLDLDGVHKSTQIVLKALKERRQVR
ncbi:MAG TPA: glycosyltransferase [Pyrinomonadaceae bacterium]|nr:glycosyltransferase [Pyrinomonadaceae bacterium]